MTLDLTTQRRLILAHEYAMDLKTESVGRLGFGFVHLISPEGDLLDEQHFSNLITDTGDLYAAQAIIRGIGPAAPGAPSTVPNGMKLGTGTTAVAKNGAGAALVTYKTASNVAFDAGYAQYSNLGAGLGVTSIFKTTWGAGVATDTALAEVAIVADQATNATSNAANTHSRSVFGSTINKGASDTLAVTWAWKSLGA